MEFLPESVIDTCRVWRFFLLSMSWQQASVSVDYARKVCCWAGVKCCSPTEPVGFVEQNPTWLCIRLVCLVLCEPVSHCRLIQHCLPKVRGPGENCRENDLIFMSSCIWEKIVTECSSCLTLGSEDERGGEREKEAGTLYCFALIHYDRLTVEIRYKTSAASNLRMFSIIDWTEDDTILSEGWCYCVAGCCGLYWHHIVCSSFYFPLLLLWKNPHFPHTC